MASIGDGGMGRAAPRAQWSDLPDELLEMARFKIASASPPCAVQVVVRPRGPAPGPAALPLLLLSPCDWGTKDKRLYSPEDAAGVLRVPLPTCLRDTWFNGSYDGGKIAAGRLTARVVVANLFSGVDVPLFEKQRTIACAHHG